MQTTQTKERQFKGRMPELLAPAISCAKALTFLISVVFSSSTWAQEAAQSSLDSLIDGLHKDAHEGNFETYFARYTSDAVFMGTDKTERWTIDAFKSYAAPALSGTGKATAIRAGLMRFYSTKNWDTAAGRG